MPTIYVRKSPKTKDKKLVRSVTFSLLKVILVHMEANSVGFLLN